MKDEEFCELCNSVINASITENDKLHIEACRTLDIILPETKDRNFDFFQSILQINRKKRYDIFIFNSNLENQLKILPLKIVFTFQTQNTCIFKHIER